MKKCMFVFLISILVLLALAGSNPVKADDLVPSDVITITPAISPTDLKEKITTSFLIEYLRQGGSLDLTNKDPNYGVDDFINNFANLIEEIVQPLDEFNVLYNPFDTGTRVNPTAMCYNGVKLFTDMLPSIQTDDSTPTPIPIPSDYSYLNNINKFYFRNVNGVEFGNIPEVYVYSSNGIYTYSGSTLKSNFSFTGTNNFTEAHQTQCSSNFAFNPSTIITISVIENENNVNVFYSNINYLQYPFDDGYEYYYQVSSGQFRLRPYSNNQFIPQSNFNDLSSALQYIYQHFYNINLYVNGDLWINAVDIQNYSIGLGQGTFIEGTNTPVEYTYQVDIYIDYDDILDRLDTLIDNQNKISFPDFSDLIIDANGQPAFAIVDVTPQDNIDDWYVKNYGTLIPLFPVFVSYPVSVNDVANVATIGIVDVIPDDILEIFGIALIGMLFVTFIHRLLE